MRMKTGQTVQIISGSDKGKKGKIIQVFPGQDRVVVDGVNKMFKHMKRRPASQTQRGKTAQKGERMEFFGPVHTSNVKVVEDVVTEKKADTKKAESKKAAKAA